MVEEINKHPKVTMKGLIFLFGAALPSGIVIGGLASLISRFIYLILIFSVVMGFASGLVIYSVIKSQKIRSPFVAILAGLFITVMTYGSMHFVDYLQFRFAMTKGVQEQVIAEYGEAAPKENVSAFIDYVLVQETGLPGFVGFILLEAKQGISISHIGMDSLISDDPGINLGAFTWAYWLIEIGIIGWLSIDSASKAWDLFCEHCNAWVEKEDHIGGIDAEHIGRGMELINRRDFIGFATMLRGDTEAPSVEFYIRTCKTCSTFPLHLTGFAISLNTRRRLFTKQVLNYSERYAMMSELKMLTGTRS